jgi:hypothetical protein
MSEEQQFDPRFNPAFQRGFDASAERARRANLTPSLSPEDVMYGRTASPDFAPPPPPPPEEETEDRVAPALEVPALQRDRQNPFVLALWLLSVVLVGGGIWLFLGPGRADLGSSPNDPDPGFIAFIQALYVICPAMITAGLGTVSGLLFWHAAAWNARRRLG